MARGVTLKTPQRVAEATRLRAAGWEYKQIAAHFGVSVPTAWAWVNDPDGTRLRARKDSYAQPCVDCGAPTSGSEGRRVEPRCLACACALAGDERKIWTPAAVILAIQEWAHEYGEPPAMPDWAPWTARHALHDEQRALRCEASITAGRYPSFRSAIRAFGSWNAAIRAAGFEPRASGGVKANRARQRDQRAKAAA
jgi:hypothetical protein